MTGNYEGYMVDQDMMGVIEAQSESIYYLIKDQCPHINWSNSIEVSRYISSDKRYLVCKRQRWKCNNCNETLKFNSKSPWEGSVAHIDHIHPYSERHSYIKGKSKINDLDNLQALCPSCNKKKGANKD